METFRGAEGNLESHLIRVGFDVQKLVKINK